MITAWTTGTTGPSRFTSGSDRLLILTAGAEANTNVTITSATYGGRAMTAAATTNAGISPYARVYIFYLKDADIALATSNNFSVNWSGATTDTHYAARMFANVNQSNPIRDFATAATNLAIPNPIVTPSMSVLQGDMVVAAAGCGNPNPYTWNNSFVEGTDQSASTSQLSSAQRAITTSGSVSASATNSNPNRQAIAGAVLTHVHQPVTYYVRPTGNDSNSGTAPGASSAWRTVTAAVDKSVIEPGDTIYVMTGTYSGTITPSIDGAGGSPIRFIADTTGAVFGGNGGDVVLTAASGNRVLDFAGDDYFDFVGFTCVGASSNIAIGIDNSLGIQLKNCVIRSAGGDGIVLTNTCSATLINCVVRDHSSHGIEVSSSGCTLNVWNCTLAHNGLDGVNVDLGTVTVTNSILAYNGDDGLDRNGGSFTHSYNLVYGNSGSNFEGLAQGGTEIVANPQFANAGARDYRLQSNSPAINSGVNAGGTVDDDLDGHGRPIGAKWDLGCYEYPLLGYWKFDEGSGLTSADSSGNGMPATLQGSAAWEAARCGQSVVLNGASGWINMGSTSLGTKAYTVSGWFKTTLAAQQTIFAATAAGTNNHAVIVALDATGHVRFVHRFPAASSGGVTLTSPAAYHDGVWRHVAAVKSSSELRLYVDGELVAQASDSTSVHSSVDVVLGRYGAALSQRYFNGSLDESQLYGAALSPTEISKLLGLVGRWRLDETSGTVATDSSPLGNHGVYTNGVTLGAAGPKSSLLAAEFDGVNDYVLLPTYTSDFSGGFTISVWALPTASNSWARFVDLGGGQDIDNILFSREATSNTLTVVIHGGSLGPRQSLAATNAIVNNAWRHYATTVDSAGAARLYVNGTQVASGTIGTPSNVTRNSNFIARSNWLADSYYKGRMRDVQLYNRALCPDEVKNLYDSGRIKGVRIVKWVEVQ